MSQRRYALMQLKQLTHLGTTGGFVRTLDGFVPLLNAVAALNSSFQPKIPNILYGETVPKSLNIKTGRNWNDLSLQCVHNIRGGTWEVGIPKSLPSLGIGLEKYPEGCLLDFWHKTNPVHLLHKEEVLEKKKLGDSIGKWLHILFSQSVLFGHGPSF